MSNEVDKLVKLGASCRFIPEEMYYMISIDFQEEGGTHRVFDCIVDPDKGLASLKLFGEMVGVAVEGEFCRKEIELEEAGKTEQDEDC
jgi:hypothetical protein